VANTAPSPAFTFIRGKGDEQRLPVASLLSQVASVTADLRRRVRAGSVVGLIFRSEPVLVVAWLACLRAGRRPLVMQYPTRKQSSLYWLDSASNTLGRADVAAVLYDEHCASLGVGSLVETFALPSLEDIAPASRNIPATILPDRFSIHRLSSGTTGFRKAIEFRSDDLRRHVADYNAALRLDPARDRIVSWLPPYHDMGYVPCFVMPLILGIDTVMMDPMTWMAEPGLLFGAIERHGGTICHMRNFAFEVLGRAGARPMPGIKPGPVAGLQPSRGFVLRAAHIRARPGVGGKAEFLGQAVQACQLDDPHGLPGAATCPKAVGDGGPGLQEGRLVARVPGDAHLGRDAAAIGAAAPDIEAQGRDALPREPVRRMPPGDERQGDSAAARHRAVHFPLQQGEIVLARARGQLRPDQAQVDARRPAIAVDRIGQGPPRIQQRQRRGIDAGMPGRRGPRGKDRERQHRQPRQQQSPSRPRHRRIGLSCPLRSIGRDPRRARQPRAVARVSRLRYMLAPAG
jgi:hypothetical protein